MPQNPPDYIPALRYPVLTIFYDRVIAATTREKTFKHKLIQQADIHPGHEVVDVGCGTGTLALWIKKRHPEVEIFGLDGDQNILAIARKKAMTQALSMTFEQGLSYDMPFNGNRFDRCFSSLFFHHLTLARKEDTFREIHRILKIGGELHLADWGKPTSILMRSLFFLVQLLDGFKTTTDNIQGVLPVLMKKVGFRTVRVIEEIPTMFGTMTLYSAKK